jgi:hypothetical protein
MIGLKNPALCLRDFLGVALCSKKRNKQKTTATRSIEVLKGLGDNRGYVDS